MHLSPAWIAALTPIVLAALGFAAWLLRWAIRLLIGTHEFLVEWPKVRADVAELRTEVAEIKAETRPNGGTTLRDVVHQTAVDVTHIKDEQARLRVQVETRYPPPREGK